MAPSAVTEPVETPAASKALKQGRANGTSTVEATMSSALGSGKEAASLLDPLYEITEQPIKTRRPIKVVCMGAGYSGLMMGILFSERMKDKNAELLIYERNADLGGTWFENR